MLLADGGAYSLDLIVPAWEDSVMWFRKKHVERSAGAVLMSRGIVVEQQELCLFLCRGEVKWWCLGSYWL